MPIIIWTLEINKSGDIEVYINRFYDLDCLAEQRLHSYRTRVEQY